MIELHNADCMKVFPTIPDGSVDLVVTDCPYRIISGGCTNLENRLGGFLNRDDSPKIRKGTHGHRYLGESKHCNLGSIFDEYNQGTYVKEGKLFKHNDIEFSEWLPEVYRVLKDGTHCYIMVNARNLKDLWVEAEKVGFTFQNLLVWDKGNATPNKYYMNSYELILMLRKGPARNINDMGQKNILRVPNVLGIKYHPTEKPVELMMILIENSSNEGDVVLDPFMGVCGGGIACKRLNRNFIGIEIDEKYFKIAEKRLEQKEQMSIFDLMKE